jgi:hypothetical protein
MLRLKAQSALSAEAAERTRRVAQGVAAEVGRDDDGLESVLPLRGGNGLRVAPQVWQHGTKTYWGITGESEELCPRRSGGK